MKKQYAVLRDKDCKLIDGKFKWSERTRYVEVMAVVGNHAMVRLKGSMPFVADARGLTMQEGKPS